MESSAGFGHRWIRCRNFSPIPMNFTPSTDLDYSSLPNFLRSAAGWVEEVLPRYLPQGEPATELYDLARDYPARGGKRFRPALLLLCAGLTGSDPKLALPSAAALELFQNFALVHDDIEDGAHLRRGKPALHRLHGIPLALNAGDLMFSLVFEALLDNQHLLGAPKAWQVHRMFLTIFRRTFEGQAMDIGFIENRRFPDREEFEQMIARKTGWYSGRGPCQLGALIGDAPAKLAESLGAFGARLGIGFQLRDDILNLTEKSSGEAPQVIGGGYGKERGGDIAEGKRTLIAIELLERLPPPEAARLRTVLDTAPEQTLEADIGWVIALAESTGAVEAVRKRCHQLGTEALGFLNGLPESPQIALLRDLTGYLVENRQA